MGHGAGPHPCPSGQALVCLLARPQQSPPGPARGGLRVKIAASTCSSIHYSALSECPRGDRCPAWGLAESGPSSSGLSLRTDHPPAASPATPATASPVLGTCPLPAMGLPGHSVQDVCAVPSRLWCVRREPRSCACGAGAALPALTMTTCVCPQFLRHAPRSPSDSRLPGCQSRSPGPPSCAEQALPSGCRLRGAGRPAPRFCPGPAASAVGRRSEPRTRAFVFPPARRWLEQRKGASGTSFPRGDAFQKRGKGL